MFRDRPLLRIKVGSPTVRGQFRPRTRQRIFSVEKTLDKHSVLRPTPW